MAGGGEGPFDDPDKWLEPTVQEAVPFRLAFGQQVDTQLDHETAGINTAHAQGNNLAPNSIIHAKKIGYYMAIRRGSMAETEGSDCILVPGARD